MWGSKQVRWVFWDWILGRNEGVNFESDMGSSSMVRKRSWVREKEKGLCRQVLSADTYTHFHTCSVRHTHSSEFEALAVSWQTELWAISSGSRLLVDFSFTILRRSAAVHGPRQN